MLRMAGMSILVACTLLAGACGTAAPGRAAAVSGGTTTAAPAERGSVADFTLRDIDGQSHSLSEHLGKSVIVISFWASWCEPCKRELVKLDELYKLYKDKGLVVLAIAMDEPETQGEVRPFVKQRGLTFPVLLDSESQVAARLNPRRSAPYNLIIGKDQRIVWTHEGYVPGDEQALAAAVLENLGVKAE